MFLWLAGGLEAETLGTGLDPHIEVGTLGTGNLTDVGCVTGVGILQGKDSAEALIVQTGMKGELKIRTCALHLSGPGTSTCTCTHSLTVET